MSKVESYLSFMDEAEQLAVLGAFDRINEVFDHMQELLDEMTEDEINELDQRFASL